MGKFFAGRTRLWLAIAVLLTVAAWARLVFVAIASPSPMREMGLGSGYQRGGVDPSCQGPVIVAGQSIYRIGCDLSSSGGGYIRVVRFDMSSGVLANDWRLDQDYINVQDLQIRSAKIDPAGGIEIAVEVDPVAGSGVSAYRLIPGMDAERLPDPGPLADPPIISPAAEPVSSDRLPQFEAGGNWVVFSEYLYIIDDDGKFGAVRNITGRTNASEARSDPSFGLVGYNQLGLPDGWAVIERHKSPLGGWHVYDTISDDLTGRAGAVVPVPLPGYYGGAEWHLAVPDASGGFWVFDDIMHYAHIDSSLQRTDPMTVFERFERMQTADFRELDGLTVFNASSRQFPELVDVTLRKVAAPVLLLGLIALALIAALLRVAGLAGKAEPLLDGTPLRIAAQVYIVLFVVLAYWYIVSTSRF